jgi:hypothetical protein
MVALKLSNIHQNKDELLKRLRGIQSPGKKILVEALKQEAWWTVYFELLYRFELYTELKVLNYTRQDINSTVLSTKKIGIEKVVDALFSKVFPGKTISKQQQEIVQEAVQQVI